MKMTVSYEWLCSLVQGLDAKTPEEIAETFTSLGAETEEFRPLRWGRHCRLAQVVQISPLEGRNIHVVVETGGKSFHTVSNSKRLKEGDRVLFVPAGGEISGGRKVEAKNIHGVATEGLLSALEYLDIEDKSPDIHIFDPKTAEQDFAVLAEDDAVYVLDVSGNRPDWLSVRGLARALSIFYGLPFIPHQASFKEGPGSTVPVRIESERCFRFSARLITGVKVEPSPMRMQKRLHLLGMRPINNMVDFSNHIMLETGQPSHAYDASSIHKGFVIRQAHKGEKLVLLGGDKEIALTEDDLLICDEEKILGLAGIMGGSHSKVTSETSAVILESASFYGVYIRRSAKRLGMKTEASSRYEKNIAPVLTETADALLTDYFKSYFKNAEIHQKSQAVSKTPPPVFIRITPTFIRERLGTQAIDDAFIKKIFIGLGCTLKEGKEWEVCAPAERFDLLIPEDLVEEVARFYGYNNIESRSYRPSATALKPEICFYDRIRPLLRGMGVHEAVTLSFRSAQDRTDFLIPESPVVIENPLTEDFSELRTHLFDGLARTLSSNKQKAFIDGLAFSEIGRVFRKEKGGFAEEKHIAFALTSENQTYERGLNILSNLMVYAKAPWASAPAALPFLHPKNSFTILLDGRPAGFFGALHPSAEELLSLENAVVCELDFTVLSALAEGRQPVQSPSAYPPVLRDITLSLPREASGQNIAESLKKSYPALKEVEFLGVYENPKLTAESKKNLTLRLRFEGESSLKGEEIDACIIDILSKSFL